MKEMEKLFERLVAKMDADRKTDKEDMLKGMRANQEKADIMLAILDANQENVVANRKANKEEIKTAMQSMWSELDESIQHRI
jgi:ribosomal protein L23